MNPLHNKRRNFKPGLSQHIVLKARVSVFSQNRAKQIAESVLLKYSEYFKVKVYHRALVGNHIHLIVLPRSREGLAGFLRVVSAQISAKLKLAKMFSKALGNLWKSRPWSRLLNWGRSYTAAIKYVALNYLEGTGQVKRSQKRSELARFSCLIDKILAEGATKLVPK